MNFMIKNHFKMFQAQQQNQIRRVNKNENRVKGVDLLKEFLIAKYKVL
jgi:hypothetical protein